MLENLGQDTTSLGTLGGLQLLILAGLGSQAEDPCTALPEGFTRSQTKRPCKYVWNRRY